MESRAFISGLHTHVKTEANSPMVAAQSGPPPDIAAEPQLVRSDAPDDSSPASPKGQPAAIGTPGCSDGVGANDVPDASSPDAAPATELRAYFGDGSELVVDQHGNACVILRGKGNPCVHRLGSPQANAHIARHLHKGSTPHQKKLKTVAAVSEALAAEALLLNHRIHVWQRVAQKIDGTVVIALCDDANTQVWISPGSVRIVETDSDVLFDIKLSSKALPRPVFGGDYRLLKRYVNLDSYQFAIYVGYITYVIAHAKVSGNVFPILAIFGGQGSGKGLVTKVVLMVTDPSSVGVQRLPSNVSEFAVAAEAQHVIAFDNLRHLSPQVSDVLCMLATGGSITARKLYTNGEASVLSLLCPVVLNGIHPYLQEPDLVQRSVVLHVNPLPESKRQSEKGMLQDFDASLPDIVGGLYDLIGQILLQLPTAKVTHPQRMLDFVEWLGAMEMAHGAPAGAYQSIYSDMVSEGQRESVRDDLVGNAILEFAPSLVNGQWVGTPQELLITLASHQGYGASRSPRGWPDTPIALSKRLTGLSAALATQGISIEFSRGKTRQIHIQFQGAQHD